MLKGCHRESAKEQYHLPHDAKATAMLNGEHCDGAKTKQIRLSSSAVPRKGKWEGPPLGPRRHRWMFSEPDDILLSLGHPGQLTRKVIQRVRSKGRPEAGTSALILRLQRDAFAWWLWWW